MPTYIKAGCRIPSYKLVTLIQSNPLVLGAVTLGPVSTYLDSANFMIQKSCREGKVSMARQVFETLWPVIWMLESESELDLTDINPLLLKKLYEYEAVLVKLIAGISEADLPAEDVERFLADVFEEFLAISHILLTPNDLDENNYSTKSIFMFNKYVEFVVVNNGNNFLLRSLQNSLRDLKDKKTGKYHVTRKRLICYLVTLYEWRKLNKKELDPQRRQMNECVIDHMIRTISVALLKHHSNADWILKVFLGKDSGGKAKGG